MPHPLHSSARARDLVRTFGDRHVLHGLDLDITAGQRLALVGENGSGKSTLLRLLAGLEEPDGGALELPSDRGLLTQDTDPADPRTVGQLLDEAVEHVRSLEHQLEDSAAALAHGDASATGRYDRALAAAEAAGVWDVDARLGRMLSGLGVADLDRARPLSDLSGGERRRLDLAALLVRRPALLLLDEPTNHLDDTAADHLTAELLTYPGAVVVASHDRLLLDTVGTAVLDLDDDGPAVGGTLSDHLLRRRAALAAQAVRYDAEQDEIARLRDALAEDGGTTRRVAPGRAMSDRNRFAYGGQGDRVEQQVARRVKDARRRLDDLMTSGTARPPEPLRFRAGPTDVDAVPNGAVFRGPGSDPAALPSAAGTERLARGEALRLDRVSVAGRLAPLDLVVPQGGRLLVTGTNASGKSTLLHVLAGDLAPTSGVVEVAPGGVALLEQEVGLADDRRTPREVLGALARVRGDDPDAVDPHGLLAERDLDRPLAELSVGQRRRAVLAMVVHQGASLLLLDEPTNHLSLRLVDELRHALDGWPGTVVVATHDRWWRAGWAGEVLEL
ncbi:ABC-F family ATP-binding cassette domain-containing protein [Flavimobilis sp. GY10621]|uniref:ABC-F family ATP-binding cassette domain-containing protein n=1 Tax=Flavimobilis rhizosphaerae TaxID=2775421 RepID=A0ABR9DQ77_9MICO|nr:ATP-binding cassette domain-containing protein [Flavimobilis rhizosphaerae]MBD9699288.1 ABC-F family ATP-binding cassette domain-containing protein [Flavimobilis rhizosphaerae]